MPDFVYTIGHSNHSIEKLVHLLKAHGVSAVADVRSSPYSAYNLQFNQAPLQSHLKEAEVAYVFLGRELGARSTDQSCYIEGRVDYGRLAALPAFREGLDRLVQGLREHQIALLCAEKDPLQCHRTILVCRHLAARGIGARHILDDGTIETHEEALTRLLTELGLAENDFFRSREERIQDAYDERGKQIAYEEEPKEAVEHPET
jgi:uncharacterized protein (DUF488 family)